MDAPEIVEALGELIDTIDNYNQYTLDGFATLPIDLRLQCINNGFATVRRTILGLYTTLGGENVWDATAVDEWYPREA